MSYPFGMQIVKALHNLLEELPTRLFLDNPCNTLRLHILVQRYTTYIVCYYAYLFLCFYKVMQFNYVWMVDFLEGHDFTLYGSSLHGVVKL